MNIKFLTLGCKVNQYETEAMQRLFELAGHSIVDEIEAADAVVINTCAVTAVAAQKSRQMIHRAARSGAVIAVVGCYAQESPNDIDADILIGTKDRKRIVELVERAFEQRFATETNFFNPPARPLKDNALSSSTSLAPAGTALSISTATSSMGTATELPSKKTFNIVGAVGTDFEELPHIPSRTRAFIKIEDGCDNRCSYCIIPTLRGTVRSRSLDSIRAECRQLHDLNFKEIVLTGIHLGAYGKDCGLHLIDAIRAALDAGRPERLRLSSIEATEIHDELIELIKSDRRLCRHLHLPLQAGCDETLRAMRRPYSTKQFVALIERLAVEIPNIALSTDLIVGFPGETEELFEQTVRFVEGLPLTKLHVFPYSVRPGTAAATMPDQIPSAIKKERAARMIDLSDRKSVEYRRKFIGSTVGVLTETFTDNVTDGLTDNYIRVFLDGAAPLGSMVDVEIIGLKDDGVEGRLIIK